MAVQHPFQKLYSVQHSQGSQRLLFAASGPSIFTFQASSGKVTSRWSATDGVDRPLSKTTLGSNKRQKLDDGTNGLLSREESEESVEITLERRKGERRKPKVEEIKTSNISHIAATSNGQILVAVTADDKTIHVFDVTGKDGTLRPRSSRSMPKRICAMVLDPKDTTIVVGDKFGDVYSLPLHPTEDYVRPKMSTEIFEPSATEFTVHTKGNRDALKQQREQKTIIPRKEGPDFELKLLLGHVSLLTDVVIASAFADNKDRTFVLTSDRDEHIRVSRYPQAHIIEGYCLGHREFVSRLCIPKWAPQYLISGGGEPSIKVFDWQNGIVTDEETFEKEMRPAILEALRLRTEEPSTAKVAVSGIWAVDRRPARTNTTEQEPGIILVALEGLPLIFSFVLDLSGQLQHQQTLKVNRNVLDVGQVEGENLIVVSMDTAHLEGSVKLLDTSGASNDAFGVYELSGETLRSSKWRLSKLTEAFNTSAGGLEICSDAPLVEDGDRQRSRGDYSTLGEFLYGQENLRKRREQVGDEAEDEVDGDAASAGFNV